MVLGPELGSDGLDSVFAGQALGGVAIEGGGDPGTIGVEGFLGLLIEGARAGLGLRLGNGGLVLDGSEEAGEGVEELAVIADQLRGENDGDGDLTVIEGPDFETIPEEGRRKAHRGPPSGLPKNLR